MLIVWQHRAVGQFLIKELLKWQRCPYRSIYILYAFYLSSLGFLLSQYTLEIKYIYIISDWVYNIYTRSVYTHSL